MNIFRSRQRKEAWCEIVDIEDYKPNPISRSVAWVARPAWALRNPTLAADLRRRQQWWKDVEVFRGPVYGLYDEFMGLKVTWAHAYPDLGVIHLSFQRELKRPAIGVFISTSRKSAGYSQDASRLHSVVGVVWHAAIMYGPRLQADELRQPHGDPLERIQPEPLRTISAAIPGFPRRLTVNCVTDPDLLVAETNNDKSGLIIAARGLEIDQIERLTRHIGIVQEHHGLLNKYRGDFRARQKALGSVVEY